MTEKKETVEERRKRTLDEVVNAFLDEAEALDKHQTYKDQLAAQLIDLLGVGGRHEVVPGVGVRIGAPSRMFNPQQAREVLTAEQFAAICEPVPSRDLAEKVLPGALFDLCKKPGTKPSVRRI